jgi:uncharacterized protein YbbC (DUF1343 family)
MCLLGTVVPGVQWFPWRTTVAKRSVDDADSSLSSVLHSSPFAAGVQILCAIRDLSSPADAFQWDGSWFGHPGTELIDFYAGTPSLREMIDAGASAAEILSHYEADVHLFRERRKQYLLY